MRFNAIDRLRVVGNIHKSQDETSFEEFTDSLNEPFHIHENNYELENLIQTYENLNAFKNSVMKYGLTRSLISMADYNKSLSENIPEIPSLENLHSDRSAKNSADIVAAVEVKLGTLADYIKQKIKDKISNLTKRKEINDRTWNSYLNKMHTLYTIITKDERIFDEKEAREREVKLPKYDELIHNMKLIKELPRILQEIVDHKLPVSKEEFDHWIVEIREKIKPVEKVYVHTFSDTGRIIYNNENVIDEDYKKLSLSELGYDSIEKFHEIYDLFVESLKAFNKDVSYTNIQEPPEGDLHIFYDAFDVIDDLVYSSYRTNTWLTSKSMTAMKAIFWCTDKKKD